MKNGVVRLTETAPTGTRRLEAAVLARSIQGVRAVKDGTHVMMSGNCPAFSFGPCDAEIILHVPVGTAVEVDGRLVSSKKATGRHAEYDEILKEIRSGA